MIGTISNVCDRYLYIKSIIKNITFSLGFKDPKFDESLDNFKLLVGISNYSDRQNTNNLLPVIISLSSSLLFQLKIFYCKDCKPFMFSTQSIKNNIQKLINYLNTLDLIFKFEIDNTINCLILKNDTDFNTHSNKKCELLVYQLFCQAISIYNETQNSIYEILNGSEVVLEKFRCYQKYERFYLKTESPSIDLLFPYSTYVHSFSNLEEFILETELIEKLQQKIDIFKWYIIDYNNSSIEYPIYKGIKLNSIHILSKTEFSLFMKLRFYLLNEQALLINGGSNLYLYMDLGKTIFSFAEFPLIRNLRRVSFQEYNSELENILFDFYLNFIINVLDFRFITKEDFDVYDRDNNCVLLGKKVRLCKLFDSQIFSNNSGFLIQDHDTICIIYFEDYFTSLTQ